MTAAMQILEPEIEVLGEKIKAAVPKMTERQKGYILGFSEALAEQNEEEKEMQEKEER